MNFFTVVCADTLTGAINAINATQPARSGNGWTCFAPDSTTLNSIFHEIASNMDMLRVVK